MYHIRSSYEFYHLGIEQTSKYIPSQNLPMPRTTVSMHVLDQNLCITVACDNHHGIL